MFDPERLVDAYALPEDGEAHLRMNCVASLDGAATRDGLSGGLNDPWDHQVFQTLRMLSHAVLVGAGTLRQEGYTGLRVEADGLDWRREHGLADHPACVAVSSRLDLDPDAALFADAPTRPFVLTHAAAPRERRRALARVAEVIVAGDAEVDLAAGLAELGRRGHRHVLCEGGPHLFGSLLAADVVDELCLTLSPTLEGGPAGRIAVGDRATPRRMRLAHALPGGSMLFLRYTRL